MVNTHCPGTCTRPTLATPGRSLARWPPPRRSVLGQGQQRRETLAGRGEEGLDVRQAGERVGLHCQELVKAEMTGHGGARVWAGIHSSLHLCHLPLHFHPHSCHHHQLSYPHLQPSSLPIPTPTPSPQSPPSHPHLQAHLTIVTAIVTCPFVITVPLFFISVVI